MIIINPGTEGRSEATLANAIKIAARIAEILGEPVTRDDAFDSPAGGFFGFTIRKRAGGLIELQLPGDHLEEFFRSQPFVSRRCYVDGSSWLWKYAEGIIIDKLAEKS